MCLHVGIEVFAESVERVEESRMNRFRHLAQPEPADVIDFIRFVVPDIVAFYEDKERDGDPVRLFAVMLAQNVMRRKTSLNLALAAVFLHHFPQYVLLQGFSEVERSGAQVPGPLLIPTGLTPLLKQEVPVPVVAVERRGHAREVESFSHMLSVVSDAMYLVKAMRNAQFEIRNQKFPQCGNFCWYARRESNPHPRFRRPVFYPLNHGR